MRINELSIKGAKVMQCGNDNLDEKTKNSNCAVERVNTIEAGLDHDCV